MAVLIKGMDFPDGCYNCPLRDGNGCFVKKHIILIKLKEMRPSWCPLIEVKEPNKADEQLLKDAGFEL